MCVCLIANDGVGGGAVGGSITDSNTYIIINLSDEVLFPMNSNIYQKSGEYASYLTYL